MMLIVHAGTSKTQCLHPESIIRLREENDMEDIEKLETANKGDNDQISSVYNEMATYLACFREAHDWDTHDTKNALYTTFSKSPSN